VVTVVGGVVWGGAEEEPPFLAESGVDEMVACLGGRRLFTACLRSGKDDEKQCCRMAESGVDEMVACLGGRRLFTA